MHEYVKMNTSIEQWLYRMLWNKYSHTHIKHVSGPTKTHNTHKQIETATLYQGTHMMHTTYKAKGRGVILT